MKKIKLFYFVLLILIFSSSLIKAELIDGPANIREEPDGKVILSLNSDSVIGCHGIAKKGWYRIGITVYVKESSLTEDEKIKKDQILYDKNGNAIGKTTDIICPVEWEDFKYIKDKGMYYCVINGYTYQDNVKPSSLLENLVADIIRTKKQEITISNYREIFLVEEYGYEFFDLFENGIYKSIAVPEYSAGPYSNGLRLILVFYQDKLVAMIYTYCEIKIDFIENKILKNGWGYKIGYVKRLNSDIKKSIEKYYIGELSHVD